MASPIALGHAGWLRPGPYRWARAVGWLCLLTILCVAAFNVAADASLRLAALAAGETFVSRAASPAGARLLAVLTGSAAMLGVYAAAVALVERRRVPEVGLARLLPDLLGGLLVGGLLIAAIVAPMWGAGWVRITTTPVTHVAEALKQSVQSGVIEEVVMRIILFRLLWRAIGVVPALILTALVFGGLHLSNPDSSLFAALCLIAGEGVAAGLYLLTGRVWMAIGMHAGWNFAQGWIFGAVVSGTDGFGGGPLRTAPAEGVSAFLSGGGFGPEASLSALAVSLIASIAFLMAAWKRGRFVADPPPDKDGAAAPADIDRRTEESP